MKIVTWSTQKTADSKTTNFLREIFEKENQGTTKEYCPRNMKKPFTEEESMASKKLKNGKSPSIDNMYADYIKYVQGTTHQIMLIY